jgi:hypothetical protein
LDVRCSIFLLLKQDEVSYKGSGFSPAAGQKNGRPNRKRNFFNEVSYKVSGFRFRICWYKPPKGKEGNWLETIPGKSWFVVLRMYGPLEPWIKKTWRPGEIELVE